MRIEDLTEEHQGDVRYLILEGLREHWGRIDPGLNPDLGDMAETYRGGRTLVVVDEGQVVGTGTIVPRADHRAEIVRMSVAATHRRLGVGRLIVDELMTTARSWSADRVVLETSTEWTGSVEFYLRCGFRVTHVEDGEFGSDTWFERAVT